MDEKLRQIKLENLRKGNETQQKNAIERYYKDPAVCKQCKKIIELDGKQKTSAIKKKQFCNHSCAAQYNNNGVDRWADRRASVTPIAKRNRTVRTINPKAIIAACEHCGTEIVFVPQPSKTRPNSYWYTKRQYCDECITQVRSKNTKQRTREKYLKEGHTNGIAILQSTLAELIAGGVTKAELREHSKTFQYYQIYINTHARKIYENSGQLKVCKICGYNLHAEICHIKDVKGFDGDTPILEINDITNLVALCRNHHWEFDHGFLTLG